VTAAPRRVGLVGGTFDPVHAGHLWLAAAALAHAGCAEAWLVPAARPPHRPAPGATFADRLAMCRLAVADRPGLAARDDEARREGPSYTVDTLRALCARHGPAISWVLCLGADAAADLPGWREPDEIPRLCRLAIAARPGGPPLPDLPGALRLPGTPPDVSATEIRRRVAAGLPIAGLVPDAVAAYIAAHRLYVDA